MLCCNLEGWDRAGGGREVQQEGDACGPPADSLTCGRNQHCKVIILHLKINTLKKDRLIYLCFLQSAIKCN